MPNVFRLITSSSIRKLSTLSKFSIFFLQLLQTLEDLSLKIKFIDKSKKLHISTFKTLQRRNHFKELYKYLFPFSAVSVAKIDLIA